MKTIATVLVTFIMLTIFSTDSFAQKKIRFDREGKATINTTVKAESKVMYSISGKEFDNLQMTQTVGESFKYEIRRANEFLSSGHTTGSNIKLSSDGQSMYTITLMNSENKGRPIVLSVVKQ